MKSCVLIAAVLPAFATLAADSFPDLHETVSRFEADQHTVSRAYDMRWSSSVMDRREKLYREWLQGIDATNFNTLEQQAKIDYLLLRNYPRQTVFYDDRSFYGEKMFRSVQGLLNGAPGWQKTLDEYHTDLVLVAPNSVLSARLQESSTWLVIDQDTTAELFARRESR